MDGATGLAIGLLVLTYVLREARNSRTQAAQAHLLDQLHLAVQGQQVALRRCNEEHLVLRSALAERHMLDEADVARQRSRLVEQPRQRAQQRQSLERELGIAASRLVVEDAECKLH